MRISIRPASPRVHANSAPSPPGLVCCSNAQAQETKGTKSGLGRKAGKENDDKDEPMPRKRCSNGDARRVADERSNGILNFYQPYVINLYHYPNPNMSNAFHPSPSLRRPQDLFLPEGYFCDYHRLRCLYRVPSRSVPPPKSCPLTRRGGRAADRRPHPAH